LEAHEAHAEVETDPSGIVGQAVACKLKVSERAGAKASKAELDCPDPEEWEAEEAPAGKKNGKKTGDDTGGEPKGAQPFGFGSATERCQK